MDDLPKLKEHMVQYGKEVEALNRELSMLKSGKLRVYYRRQHATDLVERTKEQISLLERTMAMAGLILSALSKAENECRASATAR